MNSELDLNIPYSEEAERAVLGGCIIDSRNYVEVAALLRDSDFFFIRHAYIWQAFERLAERGDPVADYVLVCQELDAMGKLKEIGGSAYITHLINSTPSSVPDYVRVYAEFVRRMTYRRDLLEFSDEIKALAVDEQTNIEAIDKAIHERMYDLVTSRQEEQMYTQHDLISEYFDIIEARRDNGGGLRGLPTGFTELDRVLRGVRKEDLIIVAGRTSMGKTALLSNIGTNAARFGARVVFFSLEMGREQLIERLVAGETGIDSQRLGSEKLSDGEWKKFVEATRRLNDLHITWDMTGGITPMQMRGKLNRIANREGVDLVVVDYLQLMGSDKNYGSRSQEVGSVANELKNIAKEFRVPVIAAAQVNRTPEKRQDMRPWLSDLKESGDIEQAADVVMMVYRDHYYNPTTANPNEAEVIVAKHRNGPPGKATLYFDKSTTMFTNAKTVSVDLETLKAKQRGGQG